MVTDFTNLKCLLPPATPMKLNMTLTLDVNTGRAPANRRVVLSASEKSQWQNEPLI